MATGWHRLTPGRLAIHAACFCAGGLVVFLRLAGAGTPGAAHAPLDPLVPPARAAESPVAAVAPPDARRDDGSLGVLAAPETIELVAGDTGRVLRVTCAAGDRVRRGALLVEVALDDYDARRRAQEARVHEASAAVERARLQVEVARRRVARRAEFPDLFSVEDRERADTELAQAGLDLEASLARTAEARAQLDLLLERIARGRVLAPLDGLVAERLVDPGASVSAGQPLLRLADSSAWIARFAVPARTPGLRVGSIVGVTLEDGAPAGCATVERLSPALDEASRLVFAEARLHARVPPGVPLGSALRVRVGDGACARGASRG